MPTSNLYLAPDVITLVDQAHPKSVLDVGPGRGKFGVLIREYVPTLERIDAVEAWEPYVTDLLRCIYDEVFVRDVRELPSETLDIYDLVLMSEVIEHMPKADGQELLARIPGHVVITTPVEFFHNGPGLPPTETHRSVWSVEDFGDRVEAGGVKMGGVVVRLANLENQEIQESQESRA